MNRDRMNMLRWIRLHWRRLSFVTVGVIAGLVVTGAAFAAGGGISPQKQAFLDHLASEQATAAAGPHAPKPANAGQVGLAPCPNTINVKILPVQPWTLPYSGEQNLVNQAWVVLSTGDPYEIWAGATDTDPQQGVLVVFRMDKDPCKVAPDQTLAYMRSFPSPTRSGALTLTGMSGDTVQFSEAGGGNGSFNFVTSQYVGS